MKYSLEVCLFAFMVAGSTVSIQAQTPAMRQGVSVQMARTNNAVAFPAADEEDAWIITVAADGKLFFGTTPVTSGSLLDEMKSTPRHRDAKLYIKADARAPFADVKKVLNAARTDMFESAVLLTSGNETSSLGKLVAPKGLEVKIGGEPGGAVVVQLHISAQPRPAIKVNDQEIALSDLQTKLNEALQNRSDRVVEVRAEGQLPFAQVASVIDACSSVKAKVALPTPGA